MTGRLTIRMLSIVQVLLALWLALWAALLIHTLWLAGVLAPTPPESTTGYVVVHFDGLALGLAAPALLLIAVTVFKRMVQRRVF